MSAHSLRPRSSSSPSPTPPLRRAQLRAAVLLVQVACWLLAAKHVARTSAHVAFRMVEVARAIAPEEHVGDATGASIDDEDATSLA